MLMIHESGPTVQFLQLFIIGPIEQRFWDRPALRDAKVLHLLQCKGWHISSVLCLDSIEIRSGYILQHEG